MYAIVAVVEAFSFCLVMTAIAWLWHLYGAPPLMHDFGVRYVVPVIVLMGVVSLILLGVDEQQRGQFHPDSGPTSAGLALGMGVVLAVVLVWLAVEVRRFRARRGGIHPFS